MRTSSNLEPAPWRRPTPVTPVKSPRPEADAALRLIGATAHLARDREVFGEGEPADQVFKVVSGAVRGFRVLADGRRQICDFYLPGDIFGLDLGETYRIAAEALCDTVLIVARRSLLGEGRDPAAARALFNLAMEQLRRGQELALTLGRRSARERMGCFLLDLESRLGESACLDLPMSRQDIADHLGLTIETVSRTLTQMQNAGLVRISGARSVELRQRQALSGLRA